MRTYLVWGIIVVFFALGLYDMAHGDFKKGIAGMCLGLANWLLF